MTVKPFNNLFDAIMKIEKYILTRSQFDALSREEQVFLAQMLHYLNEIWIVQKTLLVSNKGLKTRAGVALSAQVAQSNFFIKLHAGLLYEAWRTIEKSYGKLDRDHSYDLPQEAKDSLASLKRYFNRGNPLVKYIRQKHAFHCDADRIAEGIDIVSRDEPLEVYMAAQGGNFFCPQAELMGNASLLEFTNADDIAQATERFMLEILVEVTDMVTTFAQGFSAMLLARAGAIRSSEDPAIATGPQSSIELPYFMEKDQSIEQDESTLSAGAADSVIHAVSHQHMYDHHKTIELIERTFPNLSEDLHDEIADGLLHVQMGAFARYAQQVIDSKDVSSWQRVCDTFMGIWQKCNPDVENALNVSFLENIAFHGSDCDRSWAYDSMPDEMRKAFDEMERYNDSLNGEQRD